jgi:hypothetical protein
MNARRALEILDGFTRNQLAFTAQEVDELVKAKLVAEVKPFDYQTLQWLTTAVIEAGQSWGDPELVAKLEAKYAELDERLKSDWHRFTTTKKHVAEEEQTLRALRRLLAHVKDPVEMARLAEIAPNTQYRKCAALGDELYAITARGSRVAAALRSRVDRYKDFPLAAFLKAFDKTEAKMDAFAGDISTLSTNIGYVKKNPHQVVIGLAKTGKPAAEALHAYRNGVRMTGAPDVAVTIARNAASYGGSDNVTGRLQAAVQLLQRAGFPRTPVTFGAAKTLLPFEPLESGVQRFNQISALLNQQPAFRVPAEANVKLTARLMPADATPADLVRRAAIAYQALLQVETGTHLQANDRFDAVAIAAMVRSDDQIMPLVVRRHAIEIELVRHHITTTEWAGADSLECVACPGTPTEVAETVGTLMQQIARKQGRDPQRGDVAIAVAFAKRFAY